MLTWLLFYTSLLDLEKTPEQDVLDPGGLVKSQVVQSADGGAAHRPQRLAVAHALSSRFLCGGVRLGRAAHRLCDRRHLRDRRAPARRNGVALLPIPENYYDDLEAKTDLSAERIEALQGAQHPLRPGRRDGEYLQVYTADLRGPLLLRDRRAARLQGLRRRQRADPAGRPGAPRARFSLPVVSPPPVPKAGLRHVRGEEDAPRVGAVCLREPKPRTHRSRRQLVRRV